MIEVMEKDTWRHIHNVTDDLLQRVIDKRRKAFRDKTVKEFENSPPPASIGGRAVRYRHPPPSSPPHGVKGKR